MSGLERAGGTPQPVARSRSCSYSRRLLSSSRSILTTPRAQQYLANYGPPADRFLSAVARIDAEAPRPVGLIVGEDFSEYPLWVLLGAGPGAGSGVRLEHVDVPATDGLRVGPTRAPDVVLRSGPRAPGWIATGFGPYRRIWREGELAIYEPDRQPIARDGVGGWSWR